MFLQPSFSTRFNNKEFFDLDHMSQNLYKGLVLIYDYFLMKNDHAINF